MKSLLYLDTSALIKLYVDEDGSPEVGDWVEATEAVATHEIAFIESRSALARKYREGTLAEQEYLSTWAAFSGEWEHYIRIALPSSLIQQAAEYTETFALRAYDSVHLAAADYAVRQLGVEVRFGCFDRALNRAAQAAGFEVLVE
jgi:predicted nucleic acid-binding protein